MLQIRTLRCRVTVKTKSKDSPANKPAGAPKPSFRHIMPAPMATTGQAPAPPSQTATEGKGDGMGEAKPVRAAGTDPLKVADRVYELIKEEIRLGKLRGGK